MPDIFSSNSSMHDLIFIIFDPSVTERLGNKKMFNFLPHHVNSVSALPGETQTRENASFQLNTVCCFARKYAKLTEVITKVTFRLENINKSIDCVH